MGELMDKLAEASKEFDRLVIEVYKAKQALDVANSNKLAQQELVKDILDKMKDRFED